MHLLSITLTFLTAFALHTTSLPTSPQSQNLAPTTNVPPLLPHAVRPLTHPLTTPSHPPLPKRDLMLTEWLPGWHLLFEDFQLLLPGTPSLSGLAAFYSAVETYASSKAAATAATSDALPSSPVEIAFGNLKLNVVCYGASVPWGFVGEFAQMLRAMTTRNGFAGFYRAELFNVAAGVTVYVTLHLAQVAAAA